MTAEGTAWGRGSRSESQSRAGKHSEQEQTPLIIFDCDGVLVETEAVGARVDQAILAEHGWHLSIEEVAERFVGATADHFVATVEHHLGIQLGFDWHERYGERYRLAYERELTAVEGIAEALEALPFPICVASNSSGDHVASVLRQTGLLQHFEGRIFSATEVARGKPAPDVFLHAAQALGFGPAGCIVVEDSVFGVLAARSAGMRVLGYGGGLTPVASLEALSTRVVTSMLELPQAIQDLVSATLR